VTSGLGEVYPAGYPVAEVSRIQGVAGEPFLTIEARPFAELNKVKNILLLDQPLLERRETVPDNLGKIENSEAKEAALKGKETIQIAPQVTSEPQ
jgi:rod shape-determining protein MreC